MILRKHLPNRTPGLLRRATRQPLIEPLEQRMFLDAVPLIQTVSLSDGPAIIAPPSPTPLPSDSPYGTSLDTRVEHNKPFSAAIASFHDPDPTDASAYSATLDWGNGNTAAATITAKSDGTFIIAGSNTFAWGPHTVSIAVTRSDKPEWNLAFNAKVIAVPPAFAGKSFTLTATAGQTFRGVVATYVGIDTAYLSRYTPQINWGDGTWDNTNATLEIVGDDVVNVVATHVFVKPGVFDTTITLRQAASAVETPIQPQVAQVGIPTVAPTTGVVVTDGPVMIDTLYPWPCGGASIECHGRVTVAPGVVDGNTTLPSGITLLMPFNGDVARFTTSNLADLPHWRAVVELSTYNADETRTLAGTLVPDGNNAFRVTLSTVFATGNKLTVSIYDDRRASGDELIGIASGWVQPSPRFAVANTNLSFTATSGVEFTGKLAEITSITPSPYGTSAYTAQISWGDGTTSDAQVVLNDHGTLDVIGAHTYSATQQYSTYWINVNACETFTPSGPSLIPGTPTFYANSPHNLTIRVAPSPFEGFSLSGQRWYNFIAGQGSAGTIGTITAGDSSMTPASFQASITWENGLVSDVTILGTAEPRLFNVYVNNPFSAAGTYKGTLTATANGVTQTAEVQVYVAAPQQPIGSVSADPVVATEGLPFTTTIGRFRPTDPSIPADSYTVSINWPGGAGTATLIPAGDGSFLVQASHTFVSVPYDSAIYYSAGRTYSVTISKDGRTTTAWNTVQVQLDPTRIHAGSINTLSFRQREKFTAKLATFRAPSTLATPTPDQFSATIDWGDGTTSPGVITAGYDGLFEISGTKTYDVYGSKTITVTINGPGGPVSVQSPIWLRHDPVIVEPADPTLDNLTISGLLGRFSDEDAPRFDPVFLHSNYSALIDWGDGMFNSGNLALNGDSNCDITGAHTYASPGEYIVEVIVRRNERGYFDGQTVRACSLDMSTNSTAASTTQRTFRIRYRVRVGPDAAILETLAEDCNTGQLPVLPPVHPPTLPPAPNPRGIISPAPFSPIAKPRTVAAPTASFIAPKHRAKPTRHPVATKKSSTTKSAKTSKPRKTPAKHPAPESAQHKTPFSLKRIRPK